MPHPDKQPKTGCNAPVPVHLALFYERVLISPDYFIFDYSFFPEFTRYGLVMISLCDYLTVYYFYFHSIKD